MSNSGCAAWFLIFAGVIVGHGLVVDWTHEHWVFLSGLTVASAAIALMRAADTRDLKKRRRRYQAEEDAEGEAR